MAAPTQEAAGGHSLGTTEDLSLQGGLDPGQRLPPTSGQFSADLTYLLPLAENILNILKIHLFDEGAIPIQT